MELRKKHLKKYYYTWHTVHKLKNILSQTASKHLNSLGKLIFSANKLRNKSLDWFNRHFEFACLYLFIL